MEDLYVWLRPFLFTGALAVPFALGLIHIVIFGPKGTNLAYLPRNVQRFGVSERILHFLRMLAFIVVSLTGLIFVFGKGTPIFGITHGISGMIFVLISIITLLIWAKDNQLTSGDRVWLRQMGGYLSKNHIALPAARFNAGQKILFWITGVLSLSLGITGAILLANLHSPELWYRALAGWHGIIAASLIALIIGHIYLSVFANPGTWRVLVNGKVSTEWARYHHPDWNPYLPGKLSRNQNADSGSGHQRK